MLHGDINVIPLFFCCKFVSLCCIIDILRAQEPFYSMIAAILCMQPDRQTSLKTGLNRTIGTFIGVIVLHTAWDAFAATLTTHLVIALISLTGLLLATRREVPHA